MPDGQLNANGDRYLQAAGMNTSPPPVPSDPLVGGVVPVEQVLRMLGLAANAGDARDNTDSVEEHLRREAAAAEAAAAFEEQDIEAAAGLGGITGADQSATMTQQLPQLVSGIAGAIGGALQPLTQIPQQFAQGAQQAMQAGMSLFGGPVSDAGLPIDGADLSLPPLDDFGSTADYLDDLDGFGGSDFAAVPGLRGGGPGGGGAVPATTVSPTALGPPPVPSASTAPSSAPAPPIAAPRPPAVGAPHGGGIAGMPMIPPGAMGAATQTDKDPKPDTKRVSVPPVRNGAPVQGRLIPPASPAPAEGKPAGKPVAARRIIAPASKTHDDRTGGDSKSES